ncbi:hypothetical protein C5810_005093 [Salmonella enterica subsp. enterica serovar Monschaui]|nr:hypothetical protein [Salmonella enterica]EDV1680775.1 hypothetical protein [Salmonella enterica subsp. enterica serovar Monschaui]EDX3322163.1 hypothetical protein [Salmonella enterica subsp. enterica serovar Anatum]EJB7764828.1 hypothetical protein [Salmonella enterica]
MTNDPTEAENTAEALTGEIRDRLPKIARDLRDLSENIIPDIERCRTMLEAEGQYAKAARISLDLLPYMATKMKEIAELADRAMPVQLNITLSTKVGSLTQRDYIEQHGLYEYILPNGSQLTLDAVMQLLRDYELITGKEWQPRQTFTDSQQ